MFHLCLVKLNDVLSGSRSYQVGGGRAFMKTLKDSGQNNLFTRIDWTGYCAFDLGKTTVEVSGL
jgi:hypothetical protein